jgi:hypothetical protein
MLRIFVVQAEGVAKPSFASYCLQDVDNVQNPDRRESLIKNTAATMYAGKLSLI